MAVKLIQADIDINAGPANQALKSVSDRLQTLAANGRTANATIIAQSKALESGARAAKLEADALGNVAKAQAAVNKSNADAKLVGAKTTQVNVATTNSKDIAAGEVALKNSRALTESVKQQTLAENTNSLVASRGLRDQIMLRNQNFREQQAINRAQNEGVLGLAGMRYALYDVSRGLAVTGAAMAALGVAAVTTAVSWERQFANVERTVGGTDGEITALRGSLVDLAQSIPESFEDITKIATLAGQLGIVKDQVADFTEITAKFSTTTGVSVEEAGTAFGRLNSLLPDVQGNFGSLGDSIAKVGVESVATESQIIRITTQLSSVAGAAGFTSKDIIGLSGALASIGVPPELARGVFTRVFGQISRAISEGGVGLERFAQLSGLSSEEFKRAWSEDASGTFVKFMSGIQQQGGNAEASIRALGITSVRDVPVLMRLAGALDTAGNAGGLLTESLENANNAAGTMEAQYAIIADTIASKLVVLQNNLAAFLDALGSNSLGAIGGILDFVNEKLGELTDFADTDFGSWVLGIAAAMGVLAGVIGILASLSAVGLAGYIALTQALVGLSAASGGAGVSMATLNAQMAAAGPLGAKAAAGVRLVGTALKALSLIGVVLILPDVARWANDTADSIRGFENDYSDVVDRVSEKGLFLTDQSAIEAALDMADGAFNEFVLGINRNSANIGLAPAFMLEIKKLDDQLAESATAGNAEKVRDQISELGIPVSKINSLLPETYKALQGTGDAAAQAGIGVGEFADELTPAQQAAQDYLDTFADADASFISLSGALSSVQGRSKAFAEEQAEATEDAGDSWEDFYDGFSVNVADYIAELESQAAAQANWEANMSSLAGRVSSNTLAELAKLGPEGAPLIAALTTASAEEFARLDAVYAEGGETNATSWAAGLQGREMQLAAIGAEWGADVMEGVRAATADGAVTIDEALANLNVTIPVEGNVAPAIADFDNVAAYADAMDIWLNARGAHTAPARDQFDSDQAYAEAMEIYYTAKANTKPAREEFKTAQDYANGLQAWMKLNADTWQAEQDLARVANKERKAYITAQLNSVDTNGRPINVGQFATGGTVRGPGSGTSDTAGLFRLSNGEEIIRAKMAEKYRPILKAINADNFRGFADGGTATATRSGNANTTVYNYTRAMNDAAGFSVVELATADRALLMQIRDAVGVTLTATDLGTATGVDIRSRTKRGAA